MTENSNTNNLPAVPAGIDPKVWELALAAAKAQQPTRTSTRKVAAGLVELTNETAQAIVDAHNWTMQLKAGKLGTLYILPTIPEGGIYSLALAKDGKIVNVEPAHVDRVKSPRCLPRAIRMAGTWIGEHGGEEFSNGAKGKTEGEKPAEPTVDEKEAAAEVQMQAAVAEAAKTPAHKATSKKSASKNARKGGKK